MQSLVAQISKRSIMIDAYFLGWETPKANFSLKNRLLWDPSNSPWTWHDRHWARVAHAMDLAVIDSLWIQCWWVCLTWARWAMPIRRQGAQEKIAKNKRERLQRDHIWSKYFERSRCFFAICYLWIRMDLALYFRNPKMCGNWDHESLK